MSSSIPPATSNRPSLRSVWASISPYATPALAASCAIVIPFHDMIAKSCQQLGQPIPSMTVAKGLKAGLKAAPTVGVIVGSQVKLQEYVEKVFIKKENKGNFYSLLASSAVVGIISSPLLAIFNGQTANQRLMQTLRAFTYRQGLAIAAQEAAFVAGLSAADILANAMKEKLGDNKAVECGSAFAAGAIGGLAGHPANTVLTRMQNGLTIDHPRQLMWGAARRAYAVGCFALLYKLGKTMLKSSC